MKIKIHKGSHQIGGSITEISTDNARIFVDIGADLPSSETVQVKDLEIDGVTKGTPDCDGIFVTHYHGDHVGMFEKVFPEVPIYMGETARDIFLCLQNILKGKLDKGNPNLVKDFKTFTAGKPIVIKDIKITPYCIDHSAYDAYMLLIEAEGKRILHTGDFRMHGARGRKMPAVFEKFTKNIDVLITEGTMLSRQDEAPLTEHQMSKIASEYMANNKNVFVLCSSTNIDSIASFYNACIKNKKPFIVCDKYQSDILDIVTKSSKSSFYDFTRIKPYIYGNNLHDLMEKAGFCMMIRVNYASKQAVKAFANNLLIYSMWNGYLDKNRAAFDERTYDFIEDAKKGGSKFLPLHTSGHATVSQLKMVCEITNAKAIIPIHSEKPEYFNDMGIDANIKILNDGDAFVVQ